MSSELRKEQIRNQQEGGALRILLAEDHVLSQAMTVRLLQAEGHDVFVVGTGLEAVDACRDQSFDVVLMDLQLPVLDGLNAIRAIRKDQLSSGGDRVLIWVLTADCSSGVITECSEAGADGHLTKPLRPRQLIGQLRNTDDSQPDQRSIAATSDSSAQRQVLLENVGNDEALAKDLVDLFLRDFDSVLSRFQTALTALDYCTLEQEAHSLKSPARVFGAVILHRLCDEIEQVSRKGSCDQLIAIQDRFLNELNGLHTVVSRFCFEEPESHIRPTGP